MSFLAPLQESGWQPFTLRNARTGEILATRLDTAFDSSSRRRGLLGRDQLAAGHALIIAPCSAIHTFFMRFAIDVAFIDREGVVVRASHKVSPWRMAAARSAWAAVELQEGTLARTQTRRGDRLLLEPSANV
jgi:uncharacterized membrane protein (UPF0127 family)